MNPKRRWLIIGGLLLATLAAVFMVDDEPVAEKGKGKSGAKSLASASAGESRRANPSNKLSGKAAEPAAAPLSFPEPAVSAEPAESAAIEPIDPFRNKSWFVAPPPPPPAKPVAPPLPFQYLGKIIEGDEVRVFLNEQGKYLVAKAGDVINGVYTVEAIAGSQMTFLYQPLKEKQVLAISSDK